MTQKAFYQLFRKESMVLGYPPLALCSYQVLWKLVTWLKSSNGHTHPSRCHLSYGPWIFTFSGDEIE